MNELQTKQLFELAIQTLKNIEELSIDDKVKEDIVNKLLEGLGVIEKNKHKKYTPGSQRRLLETLQKLGGSATRAEIASNSGLDPNVVSSLLNKLVKSRKIKKIKIARTNCNNNRSGRGLTPEYMYKIVDEAIL
ncbi:winged helix-turn-helix transcriptional regulator [Chroococcidiopsis sp. TS-821]|uniref:winged helix-turn-helix transcriptional regulator n=1 Tax=Chroococcidiopsis sp. TS-821 TaxID=1378066 RepID=UPI000CEF1621|nr:winged helix-turn-helix transcriptional regulator [Chroococcidiopsis sp. TS-821]PPS41952.1 hypothetical protein B1A85_15855 [Chroococcidiopsis sp. TS-821]